MAGARYADIIGCYTLNVAPTERQASSIWRHAGHLRTGNFQYLADHDEVAFHAVGRKDRLVGNTVLQSNLRKSISELNMLLITLLSALARDPALVRQEATDLMITSVAH